MLYSGGPSSHAVDVDWAIDENFLESFRVWKLKYPNKPILRVLKNACDTMDDMKDFLELVPDGVIPARGMVKALINLVQLGNVRSTCCFAAYFYRGRVEGGEC